MLDSFRLPLTVVGRVLLALMFILSGVDKLIHIAFPKATGLPLRWMPAASAFKKQGARSARLPVGSRAGPMTYVSPKSGPQYIVVNAGGARTSPDRGDYILAHALPKRQ